MIIIVGIEPSDYSSASHKIINHILNTSINPSAEKGCLFTCYVWRPEGLQSGSGSNSFFAATCVCLLLHLITVSK